MLSLFVAAAALAQAQAASVAVHQYEGVTLNGAGAQVAAIESQERASDTAPAHSAIIIRNAQTGAVIARFDPCEHCRYAGAAWSPNGRHLAFVASSNGTATLYVTDNDNAHELAHVQGLMATPRWSPDGAHIAALETVNAAKETGATQAGVRQVGEISGLSLDSQRIAVIDAQNGQSRFASPEGTFVYEYSWAPDGQGFVATAAEGNGDNNWWIASLRVFPLNGAPRVLYAPHTQMNFPRMAPDGRSIAFIGGVMSDFGSVGGDVYTIPVSGGEATDVTPNYHASFTSLDWRGARLIAGLTMGGDTGLAWIDPSTKRVTTLNVGHFSLAAAEGRVSMDARGEHAAFAAQSFERPPHIEFGALGRTRAITHDNDAITAPLRSRSITWTSEGHDVQGWLLAPSNLAAGSGKHPMVLIVHGGPSAAVTPRFVGSGTVRDLIDAGYFVFEPNPRGSYGQGEAFVTANYRDFGGGDLRDILAGVDAVERVEPIDDARLGMFGHSYGGFMAMWIETHSNRFKAIVAGAGVSNWSSYFGENGIDQWMTPFFGGSFYQEPAPYDAASPIRFVKNAHTPVFIYVGERDVEVPAPQSLEFWNAMVAQHVPTSLVIYEGEGHAIRNPQHSHDLTNRIVGWFNRYLQPPPPAGAH